MPIPSRMTAIAIREPGAPDVLVPQERDVPVPKQGEILVRIVAAARSGVVRATLAKSRSSSPRSVFPRSST